MNPKWSSPGAIIGAFTAGIIGVIASFVPVFHWEMAGLFVIAFATVAGFFGGGFGAPRRFVIGGFAGAIPFGVLFAIVALTASLPPENPRAIPTWGTITVVVASFAASAVAASYFRAKHPADF